MDSSPFHAVRAFHQAVGAAAPARPELPDAAVMALRRTLLHEEFAELLEAMAGYDLAAIAGEAADLLYVTYGLCVACGIEISAVFEAVQQANLAKIHGPRRSDGKQLKPADWQPPDVRSVLETQAAQQAATRPLQLRVTTSAATACYDITAADGLHLAGAVDGAGPAAAYTALVAGLEALRRCQPACWQLTLLADPALAPLGEPQQLPAALRSLDARARLLLAEYGAWSLELNTDY